MRARSLVLLVFACALLGCDPSKSLHKANVDEVTLGMAKKQVESILGLPTTVENKEFGRLKLTTYVYNQAAGMVTITFKDDKVESKESTITQ